LEAGRSDEARQAFAEVFRLLDVMEENPAHRESVILAKATLYARTLHGSGLGAAGISACSPDQSGVKTGTRVGGSLETRGICHPTKSV
jgi:hypothetical protein